SFGTLTAPFDGVVTARAVNPGDLVRESSEVGAGEPLFVVSQVSKVRIHVAVPEADAAYVSTGDTVTLRFPSFPGEEPLLAVVTRFTGDLDPSTRTMLIETEVENTDRKLLPGMFGEASINLNTKVAANMLPARAVRFSETGEAYVYVVSDDETVTVTPVTTGFDSGDRIEVRSGVESGQRVIDGHLKRFETGQKVLLVQE
ncbi:MAG: efflux RND transporter periplasmic adaptor subunit, partial [Planctomycetaceae bacterium]|nr:efflux RND transporter periplasmic adaptor subunit [Planctomycetaceae bacterium]